MRYIHDWGVETEHHYAAINHEKILKSQEHYSD